jgi:hypothetical protein
MPAAVFTAIPAFEMVLPGENEQTVLVKIIVHPLDQ